MKKLFYSLSILSTILTSAQQAEWGYTGDTAPNKWGYIQGAEKCGQSKSQSPINIVNKKVKLDSKLPAIKFNYSLGDIKDIVDNGHSLQFDFKEGSYMEYEGTKYALIQFQAHEESEHTIDGVRYPLELHFVHKSAAGKIIVVGVMVKEGDENSYFEKLKVFKTLAKNAKADTDIAFDPEKMYPANKAYYTYEGSLTTPPCSDQVTWIVFRNPITMTDDEIEDVAKHLPKSNNRPVQPINGRVVERSK